MCGIAGLIANSDGQRCNHYVKRMLSVISHRGPDGLGQYSKNNISLGHSRLAILELSDLGKQPMSSASGRFTIVYNGEIYNFLSLKSELMREGLSFKGASDTEILLEALEFYGVKTVLTKIAGMFAFALYDNLKEELVLARDRTGQKPLYYGEVGGDFVFSSELKAIRTHPKFNNKVDKQALSLFFKYNYVPTPYSIFENIKKLEAGYYARFDKNGRQLEKEKYWDIVSTLESAKERSFTTFGESRDAIESSLLEVIEQQMITDVPFGAFLSGGIDSSLIVSLMQKISSKPVNTFSIGFEQEEYNEAPRAKKIAKHLGTNHHEFYLSSRQALDVIPRLPEIYCEPFSDSSQIPTFLVSKMARKHVTVCLSGDGGDEFFAGYNRHFWIEKIWKLRPFLLGPVGGKILAIIPAGFCDSLIKVFKLKDFRAFGSRVYQVAEILQMKSLEEVYYFLVTHMTDTAPLVVGGGEEFNFPIHDNLTFKEKMLLSDQTTYLVDDIMTKVDRAAMATSLEVRVPFLDKRIIETSWRTPMQFKVQNGEGKLILKNLLSKYVPNEVTAGPKVGFSIPLATWLRAELREWAEALLRKENFGDGVLNYQYVHGLWSEHMAGKRNVEYQLWDILMFLAWKEKYFT